MDATFLRSNIMSLYTNSVDVYTAYRHDVSTCLPPRSKAAGFCNCIYKGDPLFTYPFIAGAFLPDLYLASLVPVSTFSQFMALPLHSVSTDSGRNTLIAIHDLSSSLVPQADTHLGGEPS